MELVGDIEATHLLNHESIDYTSIPYKLKDCFKIHCAHFIDVNTKQEYSFTPDTIHELPSFMSDANRLIFHNGIGYDYLAIKLKFGIDYTISGIKNEPDEFNGRKIFLEDSLVFSKLLNPDRKSGHSVEAYGELFKFPKINWRKRAEQLGLCKKTDQRGAEFLVYHPEMLEYCKQDVRICLKTWRYLQKEAGDWDWSESYAMEKRVADIIVRQEHRGFYFYTDRAKKAVVDLDQKMREIEEKVEPILPTKKPSKALLKEMSFPKKTFKKDGSFSSTMEKWIEKNNAKVVYEDDEIKGVIWNGVFYENRKESYPGAKDGGFPKEPVITEVKATLKDTTHIKEWLVKQGWEPTSYKERDLTTDQKKNKLTKDKFIVVVERYVEQTLNSPFCKARCEFLGVIPTQLKDKLLSHKINKPLKVLTNPTFTIGNEKEICPNLKRMSKVFPYAEDVVLWLTYHHRRNSILGGWLSVEGGEPEKGYLSQGRLSVDSRIPTPADTLGTNTFRFKHRVTVNIPRSSSVYGGEIRDLFGVDENCYQIGYDFAGLEARIEAARVVKYPKGKEYIKKLLGEKPNDLHTLNSKDFGTSRDDAKTVKYALTYGSTEHSLAKNMGWSLNKARAIYNGFWNNAIPLRLLKEKLEAYWLLTKRKYILGLDGRKLQTRSKHSLVNTSFQSDGAICAKRALIIFEDKLKQLGLFVDFFRDDWTKKEYAQQLIAYHDESQIECSKSLVKFKKFDKKEDAESFIKCYNKEQILSNIIEKNDLFYVAYSIVGQIAVESAREAGEYYNLPVKLNSDYSVGRSWRECH